MRASFPINPLAHCLRHYLLNVRPYSWIDLVLLGYLAKFFVSGKLVFEFSDSYFIAGLLSLWFFFNILLEKKHGYEYRGKVSQVPAIGFLALAFAIGAATSTLSIAFVAFSAFFSTLYLQKSGVPLFGKLSFVIRGIVQGSYFLYALAFFTNDVFSAWAMAIFAMVFCIYAARAIVGDLRDIKHDSECGKMTLPVAFGAKPAVALAALLLLAAAALQILFFHSYIVTLPIVLFMVLLFFYENGYVLHQLSIHKTSFFHISLISLFTSHDVFFILLIYLGVFLNSVFYPLLERKSNPKFVGED